jgi:hypothetical protein
VARVRGGHAHPPEPADEVFFHLTLGLGRCHDLAPQHALGLVLL